MGRMTNSHFDGNAARKIEYDVYKENVVLKQKRKFRTHGRITARVLAVVFLVFMMGFTIMYRYALLTEMNETLNRHNVGQQIFKAIGDAAPAMGMIGTLVGLVQMLSNMSDPKSIGPAMAVALLTTLYGAMLANMFALPIADKLALRSSEEQMNKTIIIESVLGIQEGQNPKILGEILKNFLPASKRETNEPAVA